MNSSEGLRRLLPPMLLFLLTVVTFLPVTNNKFLHYDDNDYVTENSMVQQGLTATGIGQAFVSSKAANWHPLTWLSHMADCSLYGLNPSGHHLTSLLLHALNAMLFFLVLRAMTGNMLLSAAAAALFAVHPLRLESVAWVSERKDVLSGLFFFLSLLAYNAYVRHPSRARYLLLLLFYALGLMSKPMLVTLPLLLLILDWWPLRRTADLRRGAPLLLEKLPLFIMALLSAAVTFVVQRQGGAMEGMRHLPTGIRLANAVVSLAAYAIKAFRPVRLSVFYPHPGSCIPPVVLASAAFGLVLLTVAAVLLRRKAPFLLAGWSWNVIALLPVLGLVQVGDQAMADRYTYLPQAGLAVAFVWCAAAVADALPRRFGRLPQRAPAFLLPALVLVLAVSSRNQCGLWHDDLTLFSHAAAVTKDNYMAHYSVGTALADRNDYPAAVHHYELSLKAYPGYPEAANNLGLVYNLMRQPDEAEKSFRLALKHRPHYAPALYNLGNLLSNQGRTREALPMLRHAVSLGPDFPPSMVSLANCLLRLGETQEAVQLSRRALSIDPNYAPAYVNLISALQQSGDTDSARLTAEKASQLGLDIGGIPPGDK